MLLIAERITRGGVLQADRSSDIAGVDLVDVLAVVCMHLQDTAHALTVVLHRVEDRCTGLNRAGIHTEVAQLTDKRVGCNLKCHVDME